MTSNSTLFLGTLAGLILALALMAHVAFSDRPNASVSWRALIFTAAAATVVLRLIVLSRL